MGAERVRLAEPTDPVIRLGTRVLDGLTTTLFMVGVFGLWGVGIDLDHIPHYLWVLFPDLFPQFADIGGRFAHQTIFYCSGVVCILLGAYAIGCVAGLVMEMRRGEVR